jgi:aminoglycoside phosphotransferase (APT) family kinase protein
MSFANNSARFFGSFRTMTIFLDSVDDATLAAAAVAAFGTGTHVLDKRFLGLGMSHVVYRILVDRPPGDCVFRFSRGTADTFDNEIANFAAVQRLTGVRGPDIYAIDKSCSHSATPFMVMEYLTGIEWQALCREDESQRDAVRWQVGEFYGRLHSERRLGAINRTLFWASSNWPIPRPSTSTSIGTPSWAVSKRRGD